MIRGPPRSTLAPYATLFRSAPGLRQVRDHAALHAARHHIPGIDRKSTRLNSSHLVISYAVFCLKKQNEHGRPGQPDDDPEAASGSSTPSRAVPCTTRARRRALASLPAFALLVAFSFFFHDTATTEIYTLSLHDALPISSRHRLLFCQRRRAECRTVFFDQSDRKSTRLNSSHLVISYAVFCLKKKYM